MLNFRTIPHAYSILQVLMCLLMASMVGCRSSAGKFFAEVKTGQSSGEVQEHLATTESETLQADQEPETARVLIQVSGEESEEQPDLTALPLLTVDQLTPPDVDSESDGISAETMLMPPHHESRMSLESVIQSVHQTFPLVQSAYLETMLAEGRSIEAWGAFDTKAKMTSENLVMGYYQNYRQNMGLSQPLMSGGELFAGYRIGRGSYPVYYGERQTNSAGELKFGYQQPLARNREIDARRAEIWRAEYSIRQAEPEIRAQVVSTVEDASVVFWDWVAYGQIYQIGQSALDLAVERNDRIRTLVKKGQYAKPVLQDNERAIALREATLIDERRSFDQAAVKLSIFFRSTDGTPIVLGMDDLIDFPEPVRIDEAQLQSDINIALAQRPEIYAYDLMRKKLEIDLAEARNDTRANVDAFIVSSNDLGNPTSSTDDKTDPELELGVLVDVPLQRRKARGKIQQVEGKLTQLGLKTTLLQDKITAEIKMAYTALTAAYERVLRAREARRLAEVIAQIEQRKLELGEADLLTLFLREQYAIEAAEGEVKALREYHVALARYNASMANSSGF
ncbi:MAG: TolC family protein [Planctomycetaceae bacterium]|nr:TolC family protein [Planctomycetaceae bacterium]